jgi:hypothetical protein
MRFQPVTLPKSLDGRASQTFLRHYALCPRSGYLYALHKGLESTAEMQRGSALHAVLERSIQTTMDQGEQFIPGELVKVIVGEVLADPEFAVPVEEHDYLREMAWRWASEFSMDPHNVIALETLFELDIAGWKVRCRIDFAESVEEDRAVRVEDYKSSRAAPPFEEISRKRPDGTRAAKNFQLVLYALALAFGVPVREDPCDVCEGVGWRTHADGSSPEPCLWCDGKGRVETPEPFPIASTADRFDLEFVYPGIENREEKMLRRPVSLTRAELDEYRVSLEGVVRRVEHSEETGDWPAVVSDEACSICPAAQECPIPRELRDHRGTINTLEECAEALEVLHREQQEIRARQSEIRRFVKDRGPVRFGDMVAEIGHTVAETIRDKDGMFEAQDRAVRFGEPFDRSAWLKVEDRFPLVKRDLTADELLAENLERSLEGHG